MAQPVYLAEQRLGDLPVFWIGVAGRWVGHVRALLHRKLITGWKYRLEGQFLGGTLCCLRFAVSFARCFVNWQCGRPEAVGPAGRALSRDDNVKDAKIDPATAD